MAYRFDEKVACQYGVEEAVLIDHFIYWIRQNQNKKRHFFDGRTWSYGSVGFLAKFFPFWSLPKTRRLLASLVRQGVLVTGNHNQTPYDRTLWYAFRDEELFLRSPIVKSAKSNASGGYKSAKSNSAEMDKSNCPDPRNGIAETDQPIPGEEEPNKKEPKKEPTKTSRDVAADLFASICQEQTGVPCNLAKGDFIQLAKLRKLFGIGSRADPPDWPQAIANYFASPLAKYSMADLCVRYTVFKNSPLDKYNKPITHIGMLSDMQRLERKIKQEIAERRAREAS